MRVLHVAQINLPVTPNLLYGGTERVVLELDRVYTLMGLESIVAAPSNSEVFGTLLPTIERSLWPDNLDQKQQQAEEHHQRIIDYLKENPVDILHCHGQEFVLSNTYKEEGRNLSAPVVVTIHASGTEKKELERIKKQLSEVNLENVYFVAISESQKRVLSPYIKIERVVYNGLNIESFPFTSEKANYLFSLGKIAEEKGQDIAIDVAKTLNQNLVIAGQIQRFRKENEEYWERVISPQVDEYYEHVDSEDIPKVIKRLERKKGKILYVGEVNDAEKKEWYKNALVFLMPIRWNEAFGLVVIETQATGTPPIATRNGAMPEIIEDGKNGYLIETPKQMVEATKRLIEMPKQEYSNLAHKCRQRAEEFDSQIQARNYLNLYQRILNSKK